MALQLFRDPVSVVGAMQGGMMQGSAAIEGCVMYLHACECFVVSSMKPVLKLCVDVHGVAANEILTCHGAATDHML